MDSRPPVDPGWNDPPKMTYSPAAAAPSKMKLNKRIAFPMATSSPGAAPSKTTELAPSGLPMPHSRNCVPPPDVAASPLPGTAPPPRMADNPSACPLPPPREQPPAEVANPVSPPLVDPSPIEDLPIRAGAALDHFIQLANEEDKGDIRSRLDTCRGDLHQLSEPVLRLIVQIEDAIKNGQSQQALEKQQLLMVDHTKLCSQWAPAIRKIILSNMEQQQHELSTTACGADKPFTTTPALIPVQVQSTLLSPESDALSAAAADASSSSPPPPFDSCPSSAVDRPAKVSHSSAESKTIVGEGNSLFAKLKSRLLDL